MGDHRPPANQQGQIPGSLRQRIQALDSLKVAEELDKRLQNEGRAIDVFVQVNSSGEASKFGLPPKPCAISSSTCRNSRHCASRA